MLAIAAVVACGSTTPTDSDSSVAPPAPVVDAIATTAPPTDSGDSPTPTAIPEATEMAPLIADQGRYGGVITGHNSGAVAHWSVWQCGSGGTCMTHTAPMYNGLVQFDGTTSEPLDIRGDLAREWTIDDAGTRYTFYLHEDARWWDGMPVTAEDVVFSLNEMVREDVPRPRAGQIRPYYQSSRVIDPSTVEIQLNFSSSAFLQYLNQSQGGDVHLPGAGGGRESRGSVSALDCRTVRQRRLTSSFRLDSPARNLPTRSCTAALLPKHRLPVTSSLAQPQTASSALKSGL